MRRSVFVAIRMRGTSSQKWDTSGYHYGGERRVSGRPNAEGPKRARSAHLVLDILQTNGKVDGEADEEDLGFRVG